MKKAMFESLAVIWSLGLALAVGAQGPGPRGGFGPGGPGGGGPEAWGPPCTSGCPVYQFTYTRTVTQPVFDKGNLATNTVKTTGTIASYSDGSSYRDVTMSPVIPGQSDTGPQKFIYVRDMGAMVNYIEHVGKSGTTYMKFPIKSPGANSNWSGRMLGRGSGKGPNANSSPTQTITVTLPDNTTCSAEVTTITHGDSVTHRTYCPALHLLVSEDRSDRFGQTSYALGQSVGTAPTSFPFTPTGTPMTRGGFSRGGNSGGSGQNQ